jgi:WD40 repeat protein
MLQLEKLAEKLTTLLSWFGRAPLIPLNNFEDKNLQPSIVKIISNNDATVGTGFLVSGGHFAMTCAHVIDKAKSKPGASIQLVFLISDEKVTATVSKEGWSEADQDDIALINLKSEHLPKNARWLRLGDPDKIISQGNKWETFGFGIDGVDGISAEGTIRSITHQANNRSAQNKGRIKLLQLDGAKSITVGSSGSPVLDTKTKRVVGMITSFPSQDEYGKGADLAFATPGNILQKMLPDERYTKRYSIFIPKRLLRTICLIISIIVASLLLMWASWNNQSVKSTQLASLSQELIKTDVNLGLLLAMYGSLEQKNPQTLAALWNSLSIHHERDYIQTEESGINQADFNSNLNRVVTISQDYTANIWNIEQGSHQARKLSFADKSQQVHHVLFHPSKPDHILILNNSGSACLYSSIFASNEPCKNLKDYYKFVSLGVFSKGNKLMIGNNSTANIINFKTMKTLATINNGSPILRGYFHPQNENLLLTASRDGSAKLWNLENQISHQSFREHQGSILSTGFNNEGDMFFTLGSDGNIVIYKTNALTKPIVLRSISKFKIAHFDQSQNSKLLITKSERNLVQIWDLSNSSMPKQEIIDQETIKGVELASCPINAKDALENYENTKAITFGNSGIIKIWDININGKVSNPSHILRGHSKPIIKISIKCDRSIMQLYSASEDGSIRKWELNNALSIEIPKSTSQSRYVAVSSINKTKLGRFFLTLTDDGNLTRWILDKKNQVTTHAHYKVPIKHIRAGSRFYQDSILFTLDLNGDVHIWDIPGLESPKNMHLSKSIWSIKNHQINGIFISHQGRQLMTLMENKAEIFKLDKTNKPEKQFLIPPSSNVDTSKFDKKFGLDVQLPVLPSSPFSSGSFLDDDPNNKVDLITSNQDGYIQLWNLENLPLLLQNIKISSKPIWHVSQRRIDNSSQILIVGDNSMVKLYEFQRNELNLKPKFDSLTKTNYGLVKYAEFDTGNSHQFFTTGNNRSISLWNLQYHPGPVLTFDKLRDPIDYIGVSKDPDETAVSLLSEKGNILIIDFSKEKLLDKARELISRCFSKREIKEYNLISEQHRKSVCSEFYSRKQDS